MKYFAIPFSSEPHFVRTLNVTHLSWVALHGMAHSYIELDKAVIYVSVWLVFCDFGFHSFCLLMEILTVGESGSCSDGRGHTQ